MKNRRSVSPGALFLFCVFSIYFASTVRANFFDFLLDVKTVVDVFRLVTVADIKKNCKDKLSDDDCDVAVGITNLLTDKFKKTIDTDDGAKKNHGKLISHLEQIREELEKQKEGIQYINHEIKKLGLFVIYSKYEENIKVCLWNLLDYLRNPDDNNRNRFLNTAADLDNSIRFLVDGLLGQNIFSPDIMTVIRDLHKCHGRNMRKDVKFIESLIMTGLHVSRSYWENQRITDAIEPESSTFYKDIHKSFGKLHKRLNDMLSECQADEKNVNDDMRHIVDSKLSIDRKTMARSLLKFLEEKYDTKRWVVILLKKNSDESLDSVWTSRFHYVSVQNYAIFSISVDREGHFSEFKNVIDRHSKEFYIPVKDALICSNPSEMNEKNRFLIPVRAKSGVEMETLVSQVKLQNPIILASNGMEEPFISIHDKAADTVQCKEQILVMVIPTKKISLINQLTNNKRLGNPTECSYDPDVAAQNYNPLRNEEFQAYLSVKGDSTEEGAPIQLDDQWRNSPGQRWKFVNNQLMNELGKCLTNYWHGKYQYDCGDNWDRQEWYRYGLQIIDRSGKSLDFRPSVIGNRFRPWFLWYNRNMDCEDAMEISSSTNGSRPLRNEFSLFFLDVMSLADDGTRYATEKSWSNRPTQLWKFDNGMLRNDEGKCLAGKGWYVQQVDCADLKKNNWRWTYNEKRQIVSGDGYCLSSPRKRGIFRVDDFLVYDYCKNVPQQRWK